MASEHNAPRRRAIRLAVNINAAELSGARGGSTSWVLRTSEQYRRNAPIVRPCGSTWPAWSGRSPTAPSAGNLRRGGEIPRPDGCIGFLAFYKIKRLILSVVPSPPKGVRQYPRGSPQIGEPLEKRAFMASWHRQRPRSSMATRHSRRNYCTRRHTGGNIWVTSPLLTNSRIGDACAGRLRVARAIQVIFFPSA